MFAICNTTFGDVKDCIKEMLKLGYAHPIVQVGQKLYEQCNQHFDKAAEVIQNKKRRFAINMTTGMIHRENCPIVKRINPSCLIGAYLVRPKEAGLKMCKHCNK